MFQSSFSVSLASSVSFHKLLQMTLISVIVGKVGSGQIGSSTIIFLDRPHMFVGLFLSFFLIIIIVICLFSFMHRWYV